MAHQIFNNLCVQDLEKSKAFYAALGFHLNPQFSDDTAACVVISENIYVMLLTPEKFKQFTHKKLADARESTEILMALSFDSRHDVDEIAEKALNNHGSVLRPTQDLGFMYTRAIDDPDGHGWEFFHMDLSAMPQG